MLLVEGEGYYRCGEAFVGHLLIATAAHCIFGSSGNLASPSRVLINAGVLKAYNWEHATTYGVERIVVHPKYDHNSTVVDGMDLALLWLRKNPNNLYPYFIDPILIPSDPEEFLYRVKDYERACYMIGAFLHKLFIYSVNI